MNGVEAHQSLHQIKTVQLFFILSIENISKWKHGKIRREYDKVGNGKFLKITDGWNKPNKFEFSNFVEEAKQLKQIEIVFIIFSMFLP